MSYRKLDPKLKRQWLKALRSGKFKQGLGELVETCFNANDKFEVIGHCCLGVMAEVRGKLAPKGIEYTPDFDNELNVKGFKQACPRMSPSQKFGYGSSFVPAAWIDPKAQHELSQMNDNGDSFLTIADWIQKIL